MIRLPAAVVVRARHAAVVAEYEDASRRAPSRWGYGAERLPATLEELGGPEGGRIELPLELAWSGLRVFDVGDVKLLLGLYRIVLNNGTTGDFVRYLNREHLVRHWPVLRKMLGRGVRETWEDAFPALQRTRTGAPPTCPPRPEHPNAASPSPHRMHPHPQGAQEAAGQGAGTGRIGLERQPPLLHHADWTASRHGQPHPPLPRPGRAPPQSPPRPPQLDCNTAPEAGR